jgi:hypothetical protein
MKGLATIMVVLAIVIGVLPQLTDCQSQGLAITLANGRTIPMKCHWTAIAEFAMAVPLVGVGGVMAFRKRKESARVAAGMGMLLGAFVILLPTVLIGVCADMTALCNSIMRPALILAGGLVIAVSLVSLVMSERNLELAL